MKYWHNHKIESNKARFFKKVFSSSRDFFLYFFQVLIKWYVLCFYWITIWISQLKDIHSNSTLNTKPTTGDGLSPSFSLQWRNLSLNLCCVCLFSCRVIREWVKWEEPPLWGRFVHFFCWLCVLHKTLFGTKRTFCRRQLQQEVFKWVSNFQSFVYNVISAIAVTG